MAVPPRKKIVPPAPKAAGPPRNGVAPKAAAVPKAPAPKRAGAKSSPLKKASSGRLKGKKPSGRQEGTESGRMASASQRRKAAKPPVLIFAGVGALILASVVLFVMSANRPDKIIVRDDTDTLDQAKRLFAEFRKIKTRFDKADTDAAKNAIYKEAGQKKEELDGKYRELYRIYGTGNNEDPLDNRLPPDYLWLEGQLQEVQQLFHDMMKRNPAG